MLIHVGIEMAIDTRNPIGQPWRRLDIAMLFRKCGERERKICAKLHKSYFFLKELIGPLGQ